MPNCTTCANCLGFINGYYRCTVHQVGEMLNYIPSRFQTNGVALRVQPHWRLANARESCPYYVVNRAGTIETGPLPLEGDGCDG